METDDDTKPTATPELRSSYLEEKAFKSRTLLIFGTITDAVAADVTRRLIALDADGPAPIDILVSSPGGHLESGDAIHDIVRFITAPVNMIGTGWVGSAATHLFLAAPRERIAHEIARETGKPLDEVLVDIERDRWLSAEEAVAYGLVSRIIHRKTELRT